jgi:hypothetical protein
VNNLTRSFIIFITLFTISIKCFCQTQITKCDEILKIVKTKNLYQNVSSIDLFSSSWLYEVSAYTIKSKIYVIAVIKNENLLATKSEYVFCDVPIENWEKFYDRLVGLREGKSYGEKFREYILPNICDCE